MNAVGKEKPPTSEQKKRFARAERNYRKIAEIIEPYIRRHEIREVSTAGMWKHGRPPELGRVKNQDQNQDS